MGLCRSKYIVTAFLLETAFFLISSNEKREYALKGGKRYVFISSFPNQDLFIYIFTSSKMHSQALLRLVSSKRRRKIYYLDANLSHSSFCFLSNLCKINQFSFHKINFVQIASFSFNQYTKICSFITPETRKYLQSTLYTALCKDYQTKLMSQISM